MNWMDVEKYLEKDDRCVLPVGCAEEHAYLSLLTDSILAENIAVEAAEPEGIPVLPVMNYGFTPNLMAYPGTVSIKLETLWSVVKDILGSITQHGFKRILVVNGHGGNAPLEGYISKWLEESENVKSGIKVKFHNWWNAPDTIAKVKEIDPIASHASWMENFRFTRLDNLVQPEIQKPLVDYSKLAGFSPEVIRKELGDGSFGGFYQRNDEEMDQIWDTAIKETRALLNADWD